LSRTVENTQGKEIEQVMAAAIRSLELMESPLIMVSKNLILRSLMDCLASQHLGSPPLKLPTTEAGTVRTYAEVDEDYDMYAANLSRKTKRRESSSGDISPHGLFRSVVWVTPYGWLTMRDYCRIFHASGFHWRINLIDIGPVWPQTPFSRGGHSSMVSTQDHGM
jgi:hypothetical protein